MIKTKHVFLIILLLLTSILAYSVIQPSMLDVNEITVSSNQIPIEFNNTKVALVADFHYGTFVDQSRLQSVVEKVNEQNPDIIVLGGDYVTDDESKVDECFNQLTNLKAPLGIYAILGNNDPKSKVIDTLDKTDNINYIGNKGVWIQKNNAQIRLGGIGDLSTGTQNLKATTENVSTSDFVILAYHNPNYFPNLDNTNKSTVDLSLSGHTHGGQINLFGYTPFLQKASNNNMYVSGLYTEGQNSLVVTNGIGEVKAPLRFMATPQITIIKLVHNDN
ncbi:MAG: metallophosphoesterase [Methanobacteriaceae archaeon]|nr:metallophosphoesterase [Methanobacteriaceae archaeon]